MGDNKLVIDYVRVERSEIEETGEYDLEGLFVRLGYAIKSVGAKRVVLDTLEVLFAGLGDPEALRAEALHAKSVGFFGKSAISPRQLAIIHDVFSPSAAEIEWAQSVVDAFASSGGEALRLDDGEFVDVPVARRAATILERAASPSRSTVHAEQRD